MFLGHPVYCDIPLAKGHFGSTSVDGEKFIPNIISKFNVYKIHSFSDSYQLLHKKLHPPSCIISRRIH